MPRVNASFEITDWDHTTHDEPADGPPLLRATVRTGVAQRIDERIALDYELEP